MFLLNPKATLKFKGRIGFTSHYVPIKSGSADYNETIYQLFTSHYVPIKS